MKTTDPKLVDTHLDKLRLRFMYYVTECKVHLPCIINMDEGRTHCGGRRETSSAGSARTREAFLQLQREPLVH